MTWSRRTLVGEIKFNLRLASTVPVRGRGNAMIVPVLSQAFDCFPGRDHVAFEALERTTEHEAIVQEPNQPAKLE